MNDMPPRSIFGDHNVETMNEDDVAGELIRPLCRALGYSQGHPEANLRSQISLQYDRAYLGRKKGERDPILRGRPDFVCEVVSYARWVIEAKSPSQPLTLGESQQAHTYATHPEIAAIFYVLTNGREFRLYRVGRPDVPLMQWLKQETDDKLMTLRNILGPEAIKQSAGAVIDTGKPLAPGLASSVQITGGEIVYAKTTGTIPLKVSINGLRNGVIGDVVYRSPDDGLIVAEVDVQSAFAAFDEIHKALGFRPLLFKTASEYISADREQPSLFQNMINVTLKRGTPFPATLLGPGGVLLVDMHARCYTEAAGFIESSNFLGTFVIDYQYEIDAHGVPVALPKNVQMRTEGTFALRIG